MTRDEIIRMARESGFELKNRDELPLLERFAELVATYVRENEFKPDWNNYRQGLIDGAAAEREAIVKLVWNTPTQIDDEYVSPKDILTNAIRARGEK